MAESETGLTDLMDDLELEETCDTGYEQDVDVEIIDGYYRESIALMNDKVQLFAEYWMGLYSNCCLQRDYAVELLNDGKPEKAKAALSDWPDTTGSPNVPQLLFEEPLERKQNKQPTYSIECEGVMLNKQMEDNYIREGGHFDVPNVLPEGNMSLAEYETHIKECENCLKTVENYAIQNAFAYGAWLKMLNFSDLGFYYRPPGWYSYGSTFAQTFLAGCHTLNPTKVETIYSITTL